MKTNWPKTSILLMLLASLIACGGGGAEDKVPESLRANQQTDSRDTDTGEETSTEDSTTKKLTSSLANTQLHVSQLEADDTYNKLVADIDKLPRHWQEVTQMLVTKVDTSSNNSPDNNPAVKVLIEVNAARVEAEQLYRLTFSCENADTRCELKNDLQMVLTPEQLKQGISNANTLTDLIYRKLSYYVLADLPIEQIKEYMDELSARLINQDLTGDNVINYEDVLSWDSSSQQLCTPSSIEMYHNLLETDQDSTQLVITARDLLDVPSVQLQFTDDIIETDIINGALLVASGNELSVHRKTNCDPVKVSSYLAPGEINDIERVDNTLFISSKANGISILNIDSNGSLTELSANIPITEAGDMLIDGPTLYVAAGSQGVVALNIGTPTNPSIRSDLQLSGEVNLMDITGDTLIALIGDYGLAFVDISNPNALVQNGIEQSVLGPFDGIFANDENSALISRPQQELLKFKVNGSSPDGHFDRIDVPAQPVFIRESILYYLNNSEPFPCASLFDSGYTCYVIPEFLDEHLHKHYHLIGNTELVADKNNILYWAEPSNIDPILLFTDIIDYDDKFSSSPVFIGENAYFSDGTFDELTGIKVVKSGESQPQIVSGINLEDPRIAFYNASNQLLYIYSSDFSNGITKTKELYGYDISNIGSAQLSETITIPDEDLIYSSDIPDAISEVFFNQNPDLKTLYDNYKDSGPWVTYELIEETIYIVADGRLIIIELNPQGNWEETFNQMLNLPTNPEAIVIDGDKVIFATYNRGFEVVQIPEDGSGIRIEKVNTREVIRDMATSGGWGYTAGSKGVEVFDLRDMDNIVLVGTIEIPGRVDSVAYHNGYLWITGSHGPFRVPAIADEF